MPSASFLDRMLCHDQRDALDRRSDVAQRINAPIGRRELGALTDHRHTTSRTMRSNCLTPSCTR